MLQQDATRTAAVSYARGVGADGGVQAVHTTLNILEVLALNEDEMGVSEIARQVGMAKASIYRHLLTLVERGYLAQNRKTLQYYLGTRFYLLGRMGPLKFDLATTAKPVMETLQESVGQTIVLSAPSSKSITVVTTVRGGNVIEIGVRPGSELPLHASAQGKVALAYGRPSLWQYLPRGELPRLTDRTITSRRTLEAQISDVRRRGWASVTGEGLTGVNTIAVPVLDLGGELIATLAIVGSMQFVAGKRTQKQVAALRESADRIQLLFLKSQRRSR